jgi:hypothetical protein
MKYQRYFKPGQQLLLKTLRDTEKNGYAELMSVFIISLEGDSLTLSLPYGTDAADRYPFNEGLLFEITTEAMGLGIRATGTFQKKIDENQFTLQIHPDLQMFQRRVSQRFDCKLGIRFSRAAKTLQTMREIWKKNIEVLHSPEAPLIFDGFKSCKINISSGGVRFSIKPPGNQGELCLILINLEDGKPPVCAIAEVIWACIQDTSTVDVGTRFINILSEDQQRIDDFIAKEMQSSQ